MYHEKYEKNRLEDNPEIAPYFNDINREVAARAYNNTSHFPERAGSIIRSEYALNLISSKDDILKQVERAKNKGATLDENHIELIGEWFAGFRSGLKGKYIKYLHSHSNVASSFICGPANFPAARMQKRSSWADTHYENINKFIHSSKKMILKNLLPYGDGSEIRTNDPNAIDKVSIKINNLEKQKEAMKLINKTVRKFYKKADKPDPEYEKYKKCISEIMGFGYSEQIAKKFIEPDYMGYCIPFHGYQMTNLGAEIRRLKKRSIEVEKVKSTEINDEFTNGETAKISEDGKIVIDFGYKPDEEVRKVLKSNAFKWSRYRGAWVRKLTANAAAAYERNIKPMIEDKGLKIEN